MIPNWGIGDLTAKAPRRQGAEPRRRQGANPSNPSNPSNPLNPLNPLNPSLAPGPCCRVLYSGNLGFAHRFDAVCAAARRLEETEAGIRFLFVGGGSRLEEVREVTRGLRSVEFRDYQPRERLPELYASADVHLITLRDEIADCQVPSKYSSALAAGRPVLLVGGRGSALWEEIVLRRVGWTADHNRDEIRALLLRVAAYRDDRELRGLRARELFEEKYSRPAAMEKWRAVVDGLGECRELGIEGNLKFEI
ncbi:MAG: glycosyltransferase [Acidobacteriota bacterium]